MRPSSSAFRASIQSDARVGRRRTVAADADRHARGTELVHRRQPAAADHHVRARAVRDARTPLAEPQDLVVVRVDAVRDPRPVAPPPDVLEVLDRATAVHLLRVACPRRGLRRGGCAGARRGARRARPSRASARGSPRTASTAPAPPAPSRPTTDRGAARPGARCRPGSRRRPARPSRAGARRPSASGSSTHGSDGSGTPSSCAARISALIEVAAAPRVHVQVVGRSSCTRRGRARPGRSRPTRTPPPRRAAPTAGRGS